MRRAWLSIAVLCLPSAAAATGEVRDAVILEQSAEAGGFKLGQRLRDPEGLLELDEGRYQLEDGGLLLRTDGREITEIRLLAQRYATQRLIRPQASTLGQVLEAYGEPRRVCTRQGRFNVDYGELEFQSSYVVDGPLRDGDLGTLLASRVEAIALVRERPFEVTFEEGFQFHEQQRWEELAQAMERVLCDRPEGEQPRKIRTYGMKIRDFVPHYYLGLAWFHLDRCAAAEAQWAKSEELESIREIEAKFAQIEAGRQSCAERGGSETQPAR